MSTVFVDDSISIDSSGDHPPLDCSVCRVALVLRLTIVAASCSFPKDVSSESSVPRWANRSGTISFAMPGLCCVTSLLRPVVCHVERQAVTNIATPARNTLHNHKRLLTVLRGVTSQSHSANMKSPIPSGGPQLAPASCYSALPALFL